MKRKWNVRKGTRFDCIGRIQEFRNSGLPCDRVYYPHKNAASCRASLNQVIRRNRITNVKVIRSGEYVILIKLDM